MNQTVQIQFADKMVSFDTFLSALRNVERWVKEGKVKVFGRGKNGKITRYEYRVSELEACAFKVQDYLS